MSAVPAPPSRWSALAALLTGLMLVWMLAGCSGGDTAAPPTEDSSSSEEDSAGSTSSGAASTPSPPPTSKPPPPAPAVDECRTHTFPDIELFSNASKSAPGSKPHTAYTFAVPTLPETVAFDGVQIKNSSVQDTAAKQCGTEFTEFIGGDPEARALARLTVTYFLPPQSAFDAGAHWVRCDVIALKTATSLAELPDKLEGLLDSPEVLDEYGVCTAGQPGKARATLVMCSQEHRDRALAALLLGDVKAQYPGDDDTAAIGEQRCEKLIAKELGVTGGFTYTWTYPSADDWSDGQRFGYCWHRTDE